MSKITKVWLIIAASLVLCGCILFACLMSTFDWDFTELSSDEYETNTYDIVEKFDKISMNTNTANIEFSLSDDKKCKVECYESEDVKHSVSVKDGALTIEMNDERSVYDFFGNIGFDFDTPKITVYLPKSEYTSLVISEDTGDIGVPENFSFKDVDINLSTGDVMFSASAENVKIETSTGDICVEKNLLDSLDLTVTTGEVTVSDVKCEGDVEVEVSTGKSYLSDVTCKNIISSGSTGAISLTNVIAEEKFSIERSTGAVMFEKSDASSIFVETDTGAVTGSLLSDKVFITRTDTGSVNVPESVEGGKCEIETDTGDILITIDKSI
ncbi:MAG: DUF4097 family beta strand repeat protein [Ruminococcus sp.]|nr:DUF4097 family beta strand repeat protein [Ruminococcus sp.]